MISNCNRAYLSEIAFRAVLLGPYRQRELAERIGVSPSMLNKALHGCPVDRRDPRWKKLARIIKISSEQLYG